MCRAHDVDSTIHWSYGVVEILGAGDSVAPLARPGAPIEVTALLPRAAYAR